MELLIALIAATFGGLGTKIFSWWLEKTPNKYKQEQSYRHELKQEIKQLKSELERVEHDLDQLRLKYYSLIERFLLSHKSEEEKIALLQDLYDDLKE